MLFDAIEFAAKAHRGQYRKGTPVPYIIHPLAVMAKLLETGASQALAAAGVLRRDSFRFSPLSSRTSRACKVPLLAR